mgnify:CR=1 FL=1
MSNPRYRTQQEGEDAFHFGGDSNREGEKLQHPHKSMTHTSPTWLLELDAFGLIYIFFVLRASPTGFAKDTQQFQQVRHGGQTIASDVCAALGFATKFGQDREDILHSDGVVTIDVSCAIVEDAAAIVHNCSWIEVQGFAVGALMAVLSEQYREELKAGHSDHASKEKDLKIIFQSICAAINLFNMYYIIR